MRDRRAVGEWGSGQAQLASLPRGEHLQEITPAWPLPSLKARRLSHCFSDGIIGHLCDVAALAPRMTNPELEQKPAALTTKHGLHLCTMLETEHKLKLTNFGPCP